MWASQDCTKQMAKSNPLGQLMDHGLDVPAEAATRMNESGVVLLGAIVSALFSAYFIGSFAFVAYVLRKYDDLKDELRVQQNRLERLTYLERLAERFAANSMWAKEESHDD